MADASGDGSQAQVEGGATIEVIQDLVSAIGELRSDLQTRQDDSQQQFQNFMSQLMQQQQQMVQSLTQALSSQSSGQSQQASPNLPLSNAGPVVAQSNSHTSSASSPVVPPPSNAAAPPVVPSPPNNAAAAPPGTVSVGSSSSACDSHRPSRPKRHLKDWPPEDHPDKKPKEFQKWLQDVLSYGAFHKLSDAELLEDMRYAADYLVEHRISVMVAAFPGISMTNLCERLWKQSQPEDVADDRYRDFTLLTHLTGESGLSFVHRFENAVMALARQGENLPPELQLREFRVRLNTAYRSRMREAFAPTGSLSRISDPTEKLLQAFAQVRQISKDRPRDKSFGELSRTTTPPTRPLQVNAVANQPRGQSHQENGEPPSTPGVCRTCEADGKPCHHDWKTCEFALRKSFCFKCKQRGHPTNLHSKFTSENEAPVAEGNRDEADDGGGASAADAADGACGGNQ